MIAVTYQITLMEPLLVTMLDGEPNSKVSLNYLPGSVLRGAAIAAYTSGRAIDPASDPVVQRMFFTDSTCFLNGYPIPADGPKERSLPTPLSWHVQKGTEAPIYDFAHEEYAGSTPDDRQQWKGVGSPFRARTHQDEDEPGNQTRLLNPDKQLAVHTTRSRVRGRATSEDGSVFRYEALAPNQVFGAVVLCSNEADAATVHDLVLQITKLGGSRNAGYGHVRISALPVTPTPLWREFDLPLPAGPDTRLVLTLLSDALLRDENGQYAVSLETLEAALQTHLAGATIIQIAESPSARSTDRQAFVREEIVGGFNRKWGLPLPQSQAFAKGSIFLVTVPEGHIDDLRARIVNLEASGIGERRLDGFGRVGVTSAIYEKWKIISETDVLDDFGTQHTTLKEGVGIAQHMVDRLLIQRLERQLLRQAAMRTIEGPPNRSQISRLRSVLRAELQKDAADMRMDVITTFLGDLKKTAKGQYERARVQTGTGSANLFTWLREVCGNVPDRFMQEQLAFGEIAWAGQQPTIAGVTSSLLTDGKMKEEYVTEYALRFLDAMLSRTAKESKE